jgi:hypothetical protein
MRFISFSFSCQTLGFDHLKVINFLATVNVAQLDQMGPKRAKNAYLESDRS